MPHHYVLQRWDRATLTHADDGPCPTPEIAIAATEYPNLSDWQASSGGDFILSERVMAAEGCEYSRYAVRRTWVHDEPSKPADVVNIDREAWRLLLAGAESHREDAVNESGEFTDADFDAITARAGELIRHLHATHVADR